MSAGVARHHLSMLMRHHQVWMVRRANQDHYFVGDKPNEAGIEAALREALPTQLREVLEVVTAQAPVMQREVLDAFPWAHSSTQHRLSRLVKMGCLEQRRAGRRLYYCPPGHWLNQASGIPWGAA